MGKLMAVLVLMAVMVIFGDVCWCSTPEHNSDSWAFSSEQVQNTVHSAVSEASNKAYESASDLKDAASDKADHVIKMVAENEGGSETFEKAKNYGKQKAGDAYDATKEKINTATEKAYEAKDRMTNAMSGGGIGGSPVDSYDLHADWPSDDEDEQVENGRIKCDHHTQRTERKLAMEQGDIYTHFMGQMDKFRRASDRNEGLIGKEAEQGREKYTDPKDETKDKIRRAKDKLRKEHGKKKSKGETKDKFP